MKEKIPRPNSLEETPKKKLEHKLSQLIGKEITGVEVDYYGCDINIKFKDGASLSFTSWDGYDDEPNPDGIEVIIPDTK